MFDSIRKHQRLLQGVLLLLIFPAFAFFGISGYQGFWGGSDDVASVGGQKISRQEFEQAQRQQLENLRQMLGGQIDARMLDTDAARAEVLDGLIAQKAMLLEASRHRLSVSDDRLREMISGFPGLKKADGSFDRERYRAMLSAQNMTEPMFEAQMRNELALQTLPESITQSSIVPQQVVDRVLLLQEQTREVRELLFKPEQYAAQVKPSAADLKKFYDDNARVFETPERAKVEYLVLDSAASAAQIQVDAQKVRDYYDQNKARYAAPEQRRASHVLFNAGKSADARTREAARAKAEEVVKQARAGADFAALAKAQSQDSGSAPGGGDLGFFARDMMVKPFADAAFALTKGAISDVVETEFGYHVIKLTDIKPAAEQPFEAVKGEIEQTFRNEEGAREFAKNAEAFTNMVYEQPDSLKPAADRFKLKILTADDVGRSGVPGADPKSPLANARLLAALFSDDSLKNKRNTEAVETAPNTLVSARIVDYRPAERKPFEAVEADVRQRVVSTESGKLARAAGEAKLKELQGGAAAAGFSDAKPVKRTGTTLLQPGALDAVFRAPADKLPVFVGADVGGGYGIYQLLKVTPPTEAQIAERRPQMQRQLAQMYAQQDLGDYLSEIKARSDVKRNLAAIAVKQDTR